MGYVVTSSRKVAEVFGKKNWMVVRGVEDIINKGINNFVETPMFYKTTFVDPQNYQSYPMYLMNRDGFSLLVMGFTGKRALEWKGLHVALCSLCHIAPLAPLTPLYAFIFIVCNNIHAVMCCSGLHFRPILHFWLCSFVQILRLKPMK